MDKLLIVFAKNLIEGKVKTRLAKDIGTKAAFSVYQYLLQYTFEVITKVNAQKLILFSQYAENNQGPYSIGVQQGQDLGERMKNAINQGLNDGYKKVVLIGSDCLDLTPDIIECAFDSLDESEVVIGPAEDGGYYLVGTTGSVDFIFNNKSWSTSKVLAQSIADLKEQNVKYNLLTTLNDIDTYEDLKMSKQFGHLNQLSTFPEE